MTVVPSSSASPAHDDEIYLDLGNDDWEVVRITAARLGHHPGS